MACYESILHTVGDTPVVRVHKLAPPHVSLYVKLEARNPLGSVKDRLALGLIEAAEQSGELKPGQTVIEATSGNTGIGLAMVCAAKGYPLVVVMAESFSIERRKLMRFLGAKVVLTPAWAKGSGMLAKAAELARENAWFLCRQFESEANPDVHSKTTAQEILKDFAGRRLDYFVTGAGTGGTLKGVARVLREQRPETRVVLCEPDNSPLLGSGIPQPREPDGTPSGSHPLFRPHLIQGWSPDFVATIAEDAMRAKLVDQVVPVPGEQALRCARELARREGIFTGTSGGATFAGALEVAESASPGSTILCMLPDTGERYLSTPLFDDVCTEMSREEVAISRSTPSFHWQSDPPEAQPPSGSEHAATSELGSRVLDDPEHPVVLVALQWCEFSWSVRKLLARCQVPFRSIDLDSAELQQDGRGAAIRAAVTARTGSPTIPQLFVGGRYLGGARDVFAAFETGRLQALLAEHGVPFDASAQFDPRELLPSWAAA